MSVRRLADEAIQPEGFSFDRSFLAEAKTWLKKYPKDRVQSAVIPLLMLAQEQDGWVTKAAIEHIADMLAMPYIRVLEVATFYTQFQLKPVGTRAHVQVCGTTPCMLRGSEALMDVCRSKIHPEPLHPNADGTLSWEEVECQGACVNAPMVMIFKDAYEDLTPERLAHIIDRFEAGHPEEIEPGPQIERIYSAQEGGQTTLTSDPAATNGKGKPAAKATAKASTEPAAKTTTGKADAKPATAKAAPKAKASAASTDTDPLASADRPKAIKKPKTPDDLKMISGVGPKIESLLNSAGIYTFAQIAAWTGTERSWADDYLKFRGRIERDDWVRQAEALAKGGREEYVRVFGKEPR